MMDRRTYSGFATALQNEALLGEVRPEQVVPKAMAAAKRPWETVTPLAAWLNYMQGTSRFNTSFTIGGGEPDLVASVLGLDGTVLICWEHDNIMPNIMGAIHAKVPISNYAAIPDPFPNVFFSCVDSQFER